MKNEHLHASLRRARQTSFNQVSPDEKRELKSLSQKIPADLEILKDGSRSQVGGYQLASGRQVVLKYYLPKNLLKKLGNRFRVSRCQRSWFAAHALASLKIPTPTALAYREHYDLGVLNSMSFLATDRADGLALRELSRQRLSRLVPAFHSAFSKMARFHIAHGDLKATNIIVNQTDEFSFIDLDATQFQLRGNAWHRARSFDQERFLRNWEDDPQTTALLESCFDQNHG